MGHRDDNPPEINVVSDSLKQEPKPLTCACSVKCALFAIPVLRVVTIILSYIEVSNLDQQIDQVQEFKDDHCRVFPVAIGRKKISIMSNLVLSWMLD